MEFMKAFQHLNKSDVAVAGGKGASLGEMTQVGIPVPPGFVILSSAFEKFIGETGLNVEIDSILHTVNHHEMHTIENASEKIQSLILQAKMSQNIAHEISKNFNKLGAEFVAVRSSATAEDSSAAAWAGQLDTYLNTTEKNLLQNVQKCWASLFTPRAIFYRFEQNLHKENISVAVVVQKMVNSETSGIAFSVHPVTQDYNQLIIEAGFGLGEAIVSGQITPDSYVVEKEPFRIISKDINEQIKGIFRAKAGGNEWKELGEKGKEQVLSEKEILELAKLIIKIEKHYGFPVDVEWAREGNKFYITQSRPITTLTSQNNEKIIALEKYVTREHSLFFYMMWNLDAIEHTEPWVGYNINYILFTSENPAHKVSVWHHKPELDHYYKDMTEGFAKSSDLFNRTKKEYLHYWEKLFPYLSKKKKIKDVKELREYFNNLLNWWGPMANLFMIQELKDVPKKVAHEGLKLREMTQEYSDREDEVYIEFMNKKYPQYKDILMFMLPEEVFQLDKRPLSKEQLSIINKRKRGYFMWHKEVYPLNELEIFKQNMKISLIKPNIDNLEELKGMSAYKGVVKGKVRIILEKAQFNQFKEGEILVTDMTSPEFVPLLKKAKGIITDEGGVMCHAAIVSRELKIPCIVGTKVATQILKGGMEVEVDANKGIVRILES